MSHVLTNCRLEYHVCWSVRKIRNPSSPSQLCFLCLINQSFTVSPVPPPISPTCPPRVGFPSPRTPPTRTTAEDTISPGAFRRTNSGLDRCDRGAHHCSATEHEQPRGGGAERNALSGGRNRIQLVSNGHLDRYSSSSSFRSKTPPKKCLVCWRTLRLRCSQRRRLRPGTSLPETSPVWPGPSQKIREMKMLMARPAQGTLSETARDVERALR